MFLIYFLILNLIVFWPMFRGLLPLPTDALAGVYYPWAGQFWGYIAGIPYKNIALTDVFSQLFPWRSHAIDLIRSGQLPLWNSLSFSGYPLLANWQSAPFYPLNLLMLFFGNHLGFGLMVFLQPFLSMVFMYVYLRQIAQPKLSSMVGGVTFAFSGFMMTYLEYATTGQIFLWLPLALFFLEKYHESNQKQYLVYFSLVFFPVLTGGFFQPAFYVLLITGFYILFRFGFTKQLITPLIYLILGCLTASLQLLPTVELLQQSIRLVDHNISEYSYGILPIKNLLTFFAPDYYGNPVTGNFFGFMQYQETSGYFSVIGVILLIVAIFNKKKDWRQNLFSLTFFISLILAFDNNLSQQIYKLHIPLLSTGYASRWLMVTSFSASVLIAHSLSKINKKSFFVTSSIVTIFLIYLYKTSQSPISSRNLILPIALVLFTWIISIINFSNFKKYILATILLLLISLDLIRYTVKFTPFSPKKYTTDKNPTFEFINNNNSGNYRMSGESGPIIPANTWMYSKIASPTGYDPLAPKLYATYFAAMNKDIGDPNFSAQKIIDGSYTRYLNLNNFRSPLLDLIGNKYTLAIKKKEGKFDKDGQYDLDVFPLKKYKLVFEDGPTVVLENQTTMPRVKLYYQASESGSLANSIDLLQGGLDVTNTLLIPQYDGTSFLEDSGDTTDFYEYSANRVIIKNHVKNGAYVFLSDNYAPGWEVYVNNQKADMIVAFQVFRAVEIPPGDSVVEFIYKPKSFYLGVIISLISLIALFIQTPLWKKYQKKL